MKVRPSQNHSGIGMQIPAVGYLSSSCGCVRVDKERERTSNSAEDKSNTLCGWTERPEICISAGNTLTRNCLQALALGADSETKLTDESAANLSEVASQTNRQDEFNARLAATAAFSNFPLRTTTFPRAAYLGSRTRL